MQGKGKGWCTILDPTSPLALFLYAVFLFSFCSSLTDCVAIALSVSHFVCGVWGRHYTYSYFQSLAAHCTQGVCLLRVCAFGVVIFTCYTFLLPYTAYLLLVSCPNLTLQEGERILYIMSEFLVVLSQHVRKTGNPIRLLDLLQSCDMKEN